MKVLGVDLIAFFESEWPKGYYVDDSSKTVSDGQIFNDEDDSLSNPLPLDNKYELNDFGTLCFYDETGPTLASFFGKWKELQSTVTLIVQSPKDKEKEIRDIVKRAGASVK